MKAVFKKAIPNYPEDITRDGKDLFSIARFLSQMGKINYPPEKNIEKITEAWAVISQRIADDPFYPKKSLQTVPYHIQEIIQKALYGDKTKIRSDGNPEQKNRSFRESVNAKATERLNKRRQSQNEFNSA
jgi:hypothetical protein